MFKAGVSFVIRNEILQKYGCFGEGRRQNNGSVEFSHLGT